MNKKLLIVVAIIVALVVAGAAYLTNRRMAEPQAEPASTTVTNQSEVEPNEPATATPVAQPGAYKDYDAAVVAATKGTKVLFFHAQWCPQCRALEASIKAGPIPENVTIFKVNYDTAQALRQKYGVTLQTTLVTIDDQGNLVKKFVAYDDPTLAALIKNAL